MLSCLFIHSICFAEADRWIFITNVWSGNTFMGQRFLDAQTMKAVDSNIDVWVKEVKDEEYLRKTNKQLDDIARQYGANVEHEKPVEYSHVLFDYKNRMYKILSTPDFFKKSPQYKEWYDIEPDSVMEKELQVVKDVAKNKG